MTFEEVLDQSIEMLRRRGRISYRALKRQFELDDEWLDDLKFEIIEVLQVAVDQDDTMLVWIGQTEAPTAQAARPDLAAPAPPEPSIPTAERRHLTVMFVDLVGSTPLSERLDPEDLHGVIREYQATCARVIRRYDGHIARYFGDGILIYFGFPRAHEDDAQRAIRAGLGLIEALDGLNRQLQPQLGDIRLQLRIGIHTGLVVAGDIDATQELESMAVIGDTPNVAARVQSTADPDTVVITEATHGLITGFFEIRSLGSRTLKGISEPVTLYQVLHESTAKSRLDVVELSGLTTMVGREQEMAVLLERWEQAKAGQCHTVLLYGEAGIGKSRLVRAMEERVSREPDSWLTELRCSPYYTNSAFYPVTELLERFTLEFKRDDSAEDKLGKIEGFLTQYGLPLEEHVPLFASLLSIPLGGRYAPLELPPERQKQRTMAAIMEVLLLRAKQQPVLLIVEDLHWIDASTLDLITLLVDQRLADRVLIVLSFRPEFAPPWDGHPHITALPIRSLPHEQAQAIVANMTHGKALPDDVVGQIVEKTDGIPLFVEELTKTVLESGLLREQETHYGQSSSLPFLAIPATLHDSLLARLDRLAAVKEIAQIGSVIAREFDYELIEAVALLDEATLREGLRKLVKAGLLFQRGEPPKATYQFKHALIQDAAYDSLLKSRRQQYHRRIAEWLQDQSTRNVETPPELLAHHYTQAGLAEKAVPYWQRAGQRALEQAANLEAIAHLNQGLELLETLPESPERDRQELVMRVSLAPAYMAIKGWAATEVEHTSRRARDLSERLGEPQHLYASLWSLWTNYFLRGQMDEALETAEAVYQMAQSTDSPMLHVTANHAIGFSCYFRGNYPAARRYAESGVALFDLEMEQMIARTFQLSSTLTMLSFLASDLWMLGYPDQGRKRSEEAFDLSRQLAHPPSTAYLMAFTLYFYHLLRDHRRAEEMAVELETLAKAEGFLLWLGLAKQFQGWAMVEKSQADEGIAAIREGIAMWQATGTSLCVPQSLALLGECLLKAGRTDEVLDVAAEGIHQATSRHEHNCQPEFYRLRAEVALKRALAAGTSNTMGSEQSLLEDAEEAFRQAIVLSQTQGARILELRAAMGLGRLWQHRGQGEEAQRILSDIYAGFTEGFDTPDLQEARVLLEQLQSAG